MLVAGRARVVALFFLCLLASFSVFSQTISQTATNFSTSATGGVGQSFVATLTGVLVAIEVSPVSNPGTNNLRIYNDGNGSGVIGSVGAPAYSQLNVPLTVSPAGTFNHVTLTTPFPVVAGNTYTFFFEYGGGFSTSFRLNLSDVYAGGTWFRNYAGPDANLDLAFQLFEEAIADLQITQVASSALGTVGSTLSYAVTFTNAGPSDAGLVTVSDNLAAAGLALVSAQSSIGALTTTTNSMSLSVPVLATGATGTLTVVASVLAGAGSITHTVSISSAAATDVNTANNTAVDLASRIAAPLPPAAVASVPTLSEWATILLATLMAGIAMLRMRRQ